ncbi:MAG: hypothetical protein KME03_16640 [Aphanocapsa lilacina HA4352-LM1]|jgi:hypothetical protein|nr:hypothetical protein [Aphanocapsa lilacina HA4352-LM1]
MGNYSRALLLTVVLLSVVQLVVAIAVDPYDVFGIVRFAKKNFEPNTRYLKVEYLLTQPRFDAFIFGSSRTMYYAAATADRASGERYRFFNFGVSLENGFGIRRKLEWLLRQKRIQKALIGLDFDIQSVPTDPLDLLRQDHPLVSGDSALGFYGKYLLFQPRIIALFFAENLDSRKAYGFETWDRGNDNGPQALYPTGRPFDPERLYAVSAGALALDVGRWNHKPPRPVAPTGLEEYACSVALLDGAGVARVLVVPPFSLEKFRSYNIDAYLGWLAETVRIGGRVWDFAGVNSVTADGRNFGDPVHFLKPVGDMVLRRVLEPNPTGLPADFGVLLTPQNLAARLAQLRAQHRKLQLQDQPKSVTTPSSRS